MKKIFSKLKCKKGEIAIETTIQILIFTAVLATAIIFFSVFTKINTVNIMAQDILRYAEISGRTGDVVSTEVKRIKDASNFESTVSFQADYFSGDKVQLGKEINVSITSTQYIGLGGLIKIPIDITSQAVGRSEMYWK